MDGVWDWRKLLPKKADNSTRNYFKSKSCMEGESLTQLLQNGSSLTLLNSLPPKNVTKLKNLVYVLEYVRDDIFKERCPLGGYLPRFDSFLVN